MAEATTAPAVRPEPSERGNLDVRLKAVERVAELAALEVDGTLRHRGTLDKVSGGGYPRVTARVHGRSARLTVQVACSWPAPVARIAERVRVEVLNRTASLTGVHVASVDVTVHPIHHTDDSRRVR